MAAAPGDSPSRGKVMVLAALCLAAALAMGAGCSKRKLPGARGTPREVIQRMFQHQKGERYEDAAAVVDFHTLSRKCAGELWGIGSGEERRQVENAFRQSWLRQAPSERAAFRSADISFEQSRATGPAGRAIVSVSIQGAGRPYSNLKGIDFPMARHLGRWRVVGQVLHYEGGQSLDEENLCRPMVRQARERAERRRVEPRLGDLAQVLLEMMQDGTLPER